MLALGNDLSHDALNADVADHLGEDLLLHSPVDSDSTIVPADPQNTLRFGEVQKVVAKGLFYRLVMRLASMTDTRICAA